jgi:hypothetical protein
MRTGEAGSPPNSRPTSTAVTERYLELPCREGGWPIPLRSETVRRVCVWEGTTDA